ncbi:unnamed protein product [Dovyalis caffra]|uniref:Uncharacterized protein n=1 Tax=Dovyalis caffra TaxID=77055 RepID=A0AAV1S6S2_9ROSI|nr:unnamed protein product [Dovyalis caffra]
MELRGSMMQEDLIGYLGSVKGIGQGEAQTKVFVSLALFDLAMPFQGTTEYCVRGHHRKVSKGQPMDEIGRL